MSLECRPVDQRADDRLHEHLLTFLRDTLRIPELAYAAPPVRLSGGYLCTSPGRSSAPVVGAPHLAGDARSQ